MNRRQTEKHFKRKWRRLFSDLFAKQGVRIKPSRVKLDPKGIIDEENELRVAARAAGYELIVHIKDKEAADDPINNNPSL